MASDGETVCANDPNFAAIYSFLKVFGKLHGLELPTIVKLQEFIENTEEVPDALKELHLKLLRRALKSAHSNRWEKCMIKFCHQQGHHQEAWEIERFSYKKASTQVKLKVLKFLLEYQFTCHVKFKSAVNAIPSNELRLNPIGRDKNGCVYWLQVDNDANLCLYKEDQDEETWQLIARNREELVKVIAQLKSGEEITPSSTCTDNEASSETEKPTEEPSKSEVDEENEEEFLSPESESEHEDIDTDQNQQASETTQKEPIKLDSVNNTEQITEETSKDTTHENATETVQEETVKSNEPCTEIYPKSSLNELVKENVSPEDKSSPVVSNDENIDTEKINKYDKDVNIECKNANLEDKNDLNIETNTEENITDAENENIEEYEDKTVENDKEKNTDSEGDNKELDKSEITEFDKDGNKEQSNGENKDDNLKQNEDVSEAIEDPVMVVTGEGNGADCESYFIGEEISEAVMYFYGEGCGFDNDTGNPEVITETNDNNGNNELDARKLNDSKDLCNGEYEVTNTSTSKLSNVKLKTVAKRSLKKQPNDSNDTNPDTKKPCVREDKCNSPNVETDLKSEASIDEKSNTDNESPNKNKEAKNNASPKKNNVKKRRSKFKKKAVSRKIKVNDVKDTINSLPETDSVPDKTSIIEKRKSSVSSVDEDLAHISKENNDKDDPLAIEEPLPPKKLRLETTPESDVSATHSKDVSEAKEASSDGKEASDGATETKDNLNDSISKRKKIKARKGRFKRKQKNKDVDKNDKINDRNKKGRKSLKRSLVEATMSDKNKSESQSESDDNEPITSGKRLKIKPKKIITSTRKKIEAKLQEKKSSDESEDETLYSLAGKKSATKKLIKKKKPKDPKDPKDKSKPESDDSDTPVRQSRRIAQQKIKEEAERRQLEEVALRELKMIHKKRGKDDDDEEEWRASGRGSSSEEEKKRKHKKTWRTSDSTGPEPDSDSDSPLFELQPEPEIDYDKSDHEFSPESDLEVDEPAEPVKRARTLQEEKDDGFCKQCGSGEQPEWILLCDKCDAGYHASCLKPLLFYIPQGDWFCPPCNHVKLISALEGELVKFDELSVKVEEERAKKKLEEPEPAPEQKEEKKESAEDDSDSSCSTWSSASSGGVYRLRARRQLPVSMRAQEYDRLISAAIKEEYLEPTTSAGNQGRGKDISTIIEAAEEEKMKAEREAIEQGKPVESKKSKKKQRKKPRKLNSLEIPSEDDDEVDEDFKDTGGASSSEDISSSAEKDSGTDSQSSDSLPIRRTGRSENKKDRPKMTESSPETKKKKKGIFEDSSSESAGAKEWSSASKQKTKPSHHHRPKDRSKRHDKSKKSRRSRGLTQYDAEGNVIRARVTYGGLSGEEGENDWSPKHRTRQKKINYTEMPNTESEDEMHKSSGKHMPDSSDEFKVTESSDSDWDAEQKKKEENSAERMKALNDLVKKTAVVPLEKLPEDITKAKTEELQAHLSAQAANATPKPLRGKGSRGGRGSRGPRSRGGGGGGRGGGGVVGGGGARSGSPQTDDALAKLVGVKVRELGQDGSINKPNQLEREKKRQEREAKQAEKEAKRQERLQKKEEKEKMKEQKAKEREEKKLAKIALQESKRVKKEKEYAGPMVGYGPPPGGMGGEMFQPRPPAPYHEQRFPNAPRLQVRAELRGMLAGEDRGSHSQQHNALREGTLSVAGSPQPFKPVSEEPSIITRMPHMINQQYRGPMMYPNNSGYGPRGPQNMYQLHPGLGGPGGPGGQARQYPSQYYRLPPYGGARPDRPPHQPYRHHMQGPPGTSMHHPGQPGSMHHPPGYGYRGPPPTSMPQGHLPDRTGASPNPPGHLVGSSSMPHHTGPPNSHPQNLGPPTTMAGQGGLPSHLSHLGGHLNQLGRPPSMTNHQGQLNSHGQPSSHEGPSNSHGGSPIPHGPPHLLGPSNLHGGPPNSHGGPPNSHGGPPNSHGGPPNSHGGPRNLMEGPRNPLSPHPPGLSQMRGASPAPGTSGMKHGAPGMTGAPGPPGQDEPPIKIKAEVKTEPEYKSPPTSPGESLSTSAGPRATDDTPRHPKIKHTENKDRRPRFPLGPYAPHYAPFGPYAPHYAPEAHHTLQQYLSAERPRSPAPTPDGSPRPYLPAHLRPYTRHPPPHHAAHHPIPNQNLPPGQRDMPGVMPPGQRDIPGVMSPGQRDMPGVMPPGQRDMPGVMPPGQRDMPGGMPPGARDMPGGMPPGARDMPGVLPHGARDMPGGLPPGARDMPGILPPGARDMPGGLPPGARDMPSGLPPGARDMPGVLPPGPRDMPGGMPPRPRDMPGGMPPGPRDMPGGMPSGARDMPGVLPPGTRDMPGGMPSMARDMPGGVSADGPPSPQRAPRPAHPQLREIPGVPSTSSHLTHPPPTLHRPQLHHRLPSQPTPLVAHHPRPVLPPQAHSHPSTASHATGQPMQAHLKPSRSPLRSPGPPRRQSLTPPQNTPLHQPYVQPAPVILPRPTPPPALAQSPSPHNAHMMSQPLHASHRTPPSRTPPNLTHHLPPPHERMSPNVPVPYQYADRRLLPQPIPRDSLPPQSPPRREFEHPETQHRDYGPPEPGREFEQSNSRDFDPPESPKETPQQAEADSTIAIKTEPMLGRVKEEPNREEGGVFGGLVSYFSSQHEDDIDT